MARLSRNAMEAAREVRAYLREADLRYCDSERIADHFCLSQTAMRRKLQAAGTSLQTLKDEERRRRLHTLLHDGRVVPKRIAGELGFSAAPSFYKWFRDAMGVGIKDYCRDRGIAA